MTRAQSSSNTPMAMAPSTPYRSKLSPPQAIKPILERPVIPSILAKTPEEHLREAEYVKQRRRFLPPHLRHGHKDVSPPPPGHVRVLFWSSIDKIRALRPTPELSAEFQLEPSGYLDLTKVQALWGLESAAVIDPMRWKVFDNATPNQLSSLATHTLSLNGAIYVTEHPVANNTRARRKLRLGCLDLYHYCFFTIYRLVFYGGYLGPGYHSPVPKWYNTASSYRNEAVKQFKKIKTEADDTCSTMIDHSKRGFLTVRESASHALQDTVILKYLNHGETRREFINEWSSVLKTCLLFFCVYLVDLFVRG